MFGNYFKKKYATDVSLDSTPDGGEDSAIIHLTYAKVPQSLELKKRQYEEQLREKYKIPKEKSGTLL